MPAPRALVFLLFLLGIITGDLQAAPVSFQPYGDRSSTDVVLQLAEIQKAPRQVELENILPVQLSEITQTELSAFEALIEQYQDDEQAVALLVPLYWQVAELSGQIDQRQHFLTRFVGFSNDFMALVLVELLLELHEHSSSSLNDYNDLRADFRHQYEQLLSQLQQQEQHSFLDLWASGLLYFYMPGGGLSVADRWLQSQADSAGSSEVIVVYRKILHELAGQSFPVKTPNCWPLACADAMTTDEMARRAQRAYKRFNNDGFGQAWEYLKTGVHCLYNAQSNPLVYNFSLCLGFFNNLSSMLRMLEDSLAVNGFAAGWREYRLLKESYAETFNFQNRVSNQVQNAFRYEQERIDSIQDPETRLQASQNLLDGPLSSFASSQSIQQARQSNERQLQAIRDARKKQAATDQAYERFQAQYQNLQQQLERHPDNEDLWEQFESLTDSKDARTGLQPSAREKLKQQAHSGLVDARENNWLNRLYQAFKKRQAEIVQCFERITGQIHGLLEQMKQSPDNEALVHQYLDLLDSPDALTGLDSSYRQGAKVKGAELLEDIRKNQRNRQLFQQYQDEYDAIMATYNENPILATKKALVLLDTEAAQSLTPESREEQREYHQNRLGQLRAKEQKEKERLAIKQKYLEQVKKLDEQRDQTGNKRAWLTGFIAVLDGEAGRYFSETERVEKKQKARELLAIIEPEPYSSDQESLFFSTLEAIGRGEDPLTQGIEQAAESMVRISYQHFPQGTERVFHALSYVDTAMDAVVEFIDDSTGNHASALWRQLDETAQARILGAGKVLSVLVTVAKVSTLVELSRSARTPVGRAGQKHSFINPNAPRPRNAPETIQSRDYSGHAIDRMQERGFTPSIVENVIQSGVKSNGNQPDTLVFTDTINKVRVVINSKTGRVVTVISGD